MVPTSKIGASGQWCLSSGNHFDVTFSNEEGLQNRTIIYVIKWNRREEEKKTQQNKYTNAFDDDEEKQKFSSLSLEVLKLNILHASIYTVPCYREANEENVCLWITKRSQSIIILLTSGICFIVWAFEWEKKDVVYLFRDEKRVREKRKKCES